MKGALGSKAILATVCLLMLTIVVGWMSPVVASMPLMETCSAGPCGLGIKASQASEFEGVSHYFLDVKLDTSEHILVGSETLEYFNGESIPLGKVFFHLWVNSANGSIVINSVTDGMGRQLYYQTVEDTNLEVSFWKPVPPKGTATVKIDFTVSIPNVEYRFGHSDLCHNLANWYPIAAVYDEDGWDTSPYSFIGESFYADVSYYDVNITVATDQVVAATGELIKRETNSDDSVTWVWKTGLVREFFFSTSSKFETASLRVEGLEISTYYFQGDHKRGLAALSVAKNAIKVFSSLFRPYPYSSLRVVESNIGAMQGMEYPNLILIDKQFYSTRVPERNFEDVIVHEIGHQWFAYVVGNDPYAEPWLDECLATYSEVLYYEFMYGNAAKEQQLDKMRQLYYRVSQRGDVAVNHTMGYWETRPLQYWSIVYGKGSLIIHMLRLVVGNATFFEGMQTYVDTFLYKNAKTSDLQEVFENVTGYNLDWFFKEWLFEKGLPHYSLTVLFDDGFNVILNVNQEDTPKTMLVPFQILYKHGSEIKMAWVNKTQQIIKFEVAEAPIDIIMDPDDLILGTAEASKPMWSLSARVVVTMTVGGIICLVIQKKRTTMSAPPTSLDHFLDDQEKKGEPL